MRHHWRRVDNTSYLYQALIHMVKNKVRNLVAQDQRQMRIVLDELIHQP